MSGDASQSKRDWSIIAGASVARIFVGLLYAAFIVRALPAEQSSWLFQLHFLQGGLIALLSASAYGRSASLAAQGMATWSMARDFLRFVSVTGGAAALIGIVLLPTGPDRAEQAFAVALMAAGAAGSALNGLIQGVVVVEKGGSRAFAPTIVVSGLTCIAIGALWGDRSLLVVAIVWAGSQMLPPLALAGALVDLRRRDAHRSLSQDRSQFAAVGVVNAATVGAGYLFRERWAGLQTAAVGSHGFLIARFTELAYQVVYMAAASLPQLRDRWFADRVRSRRGALMLLVTGVVGVLPVVALSVQVSTWSWKAAVLAEVAVAPIRIVATLSVLTLLARSSTRGLQVSLSLAVLVVLAATQVGAIQEAALGLQLFQALAALAVVTSTAVVLGRERPATN